MTDKSPWGCFVTAGAILGLFGLVSFATADEEAEKAKARASAPPAIVAIEDFDPARHQGLFNEVMIRAQLDIATMDRVNNDKPVLEERTTTTVARLYGTDAKDRSGSAPGILATYDTLSANRIIDMAEKPGPIGPIVVINGRVDDPTILTQEVFKVTGIGHVVAEDAPIITPFLHGRMDALAPLDDSGAVMTVGMIVVSPFLLIGLYRLHRRRQRKIAQTEWERY
jgi:hypothetical protein